MKDKKLKLLPADIKGKELLESLIKTQFPGIIVFGTTIETISFKYSYKLVIKDFKRIK